MDFRPWLVLLSNSSIASCSSNLGGVGRPKLRINKADWTSFSFGWCIFLTDSLFFSYLLSLCRSLSYFILAVSMHKCFGKHFVHYFHICYSHTELYILPFLLEQMINSMIPHITRKQIFLFLGSAHLLQVVCVGDGRGGLCEAVLGLLAGRFSEPPLGRIMVAGILPGSQAHTTHAIKIGRQACLCTPLMPFK